MFQVFATKTATNFDQSSLQHAPCTLLSHFHHLERTHQVRISVTAVGGTTGTNPEVAAPFSSGGFSRLFDRLYIQDSAVGAYLETLGETHEGLFNPDGCAYPDVSAQAKDIIITLKGEVTTVDGTSGSSPIFASIIALLNDELSVAGKPPLGFLNPMIYKFPHIFNDITSGSCPFLL